MKQILLFCLTVILLCEIRTDAVEKSAEVELAQLEALDEIHDSEILRAVQTSIAEWQRRKRSSRRKRAEKRVCYDELGCFEDSGPFGYLDMLPASPEQINTRFLMYSTRSRGDRPLVDVPYSNLSAVFSSSSTTLPASAPTRVIVHGFGSSCSHVWVYEMRAALMAVEECNVICVDWENGATLPNYVQAAANARLVGAQLAKLLQGLADHQSLSMSKVHMIGFSLGAHVAGFAGAQLPGLSRITGLDPAGPLFESQHPSARLDQTDATFVDVIHSNGETLILGGLGSWQPMGHVDFYPNGGRVQHGCSNLFIGAVTDIIWSPAAAEGRSLCNHRRAYKFFTDSVAPRCLFPAFPCSSYEDFLQGRCFPCDNSPESDKARCGNMGYYADKSTGRGQLYLLTREEEPFCAHQYHVRVDSDDGHLPLRSLGKLQITLAGEGGLNETFSLTDNDNTELQAGSSISRMLVPHPALGPPTSVTLTYKAYSGWLSKGLPHWPVSKVAIADSFGKSSSVCKSGLLLESGVPVTLTLQPGECESSDSEGSASEERGNLNITADALSLGKLNKRRVQDNIEESSPRSSITDQHQDENEVIRLGNHFKVANNDTFSLLEAAELLTLPWQPLLSGQVNSLDGSVPAVERSRAMGSSSTHPRQEIVEPLLKVVRGGKIGRSHEPREPEIYEPVLGSTIRPTEPPAASEGARSVTVQLLPQRLAELLERAERYTRLTLLPLISAHAPRFFGFGGDNDKQAHEPKYFPPLGEIKLEGFEEETTKTSRIGKLVDADVDEAKNTTILVDTDKVANQTQAEDRIDIEAAADTIDEQQVVAESVGIHISLPTYKPGSAFPYEYDKNDARSVAASYGKSKYIPVNYP